MNTEQERADFEAWFVESGHFLSKLDFCLLPDGRYEDEGVKALFEAYQAGRAALQSQDREDAERYRWLRDGGNDDMGVVRGVDCIDCGSTAVAATYEEGLEGGQLDAAIDHARRVEGDK